VDAVHQLAVASKQAGGITFTDKAGNIIMEDDESDIETEPEDEPVPLDDDMEGIHIGKIDASQETAGVDDIQNIESMETETEITMTQPGHMLAQNMYKKTIYQLQMKKTSPTTM